MSESLDDDVGEDTNGTLKGSPQARENRDRGYFDDPQPEVSQFAANARNGLNALDAGTTDFREHYRYADSEQPAEDGAQDGQNGLDTPIGATRPAVGNEDDSVSTPDDPPSIRVNPTRKKSFLQKLIRQGLRGFLSRKC